MIRSLTASRRCVCRVLVVGAALLAAPILHAATLLWNFDNPADRFAPTLGSGVMDYHDPDATGWGPSQTVFDKAGALGLPALPGGDADVLSFPACTPRQGYRLRHGSPPNGPYGDTLGRVSNYTLIMDVLYPSSSDGLWRALYQADTNNVGDAEFYVQNKPSGGIGIIGVYHGSIQPDTWHRIAIVMQAASGEGKCQRFIDGRFVGGIGSSGSGLNSPWALAESLLLFTDDDGETAAGHLASLCFVDRAMRMEEVQALGGPHAGGALTPGAPAPPPTPVMPRRVGVIGHRGGFFCCTPDNTLASVRFARSNSVPVIEIDTRLSADGVCVLVHDATVDRTTDGTGTVASMTVAQLKTLDAGSWFAPEFAGERIPTAAEVMTEAGEDMILYFDLKVPNQIDAITNALAQTGFDPDHCWFWVYNNASDAALIRSRLPGARIIWEAPGNWANDPNYFTNLRSLGVYAFDQGIYYGTINPAFVVAAKQAGFVVSIYTILDPDTMARNAALGVDYMETDFPQIMNQVQPPQSGMASGPSPADGAVGVAPSPLLTWVTASNAVSHRVHFGTDPSPPFLGEQAYDLLPRTNLTLGATYFWRVDEGVDGGYATGAVWSFTVTEELPITNTVYEWSFDRGDLSSDLGAGVMSYVNGATAASSGFGVTDGALVPHIASEPATYLHVPAFASQADGYVLEFDGSGPNGGGGYINQFTFIADLLVPGSLNWTALFNSNTDNANDADFYVAPDGSLGISELGYTATGLITAGVWHRVGFAADLGAGVVSYYLDGTRVRRRAGASLLDGRFSLYSNADPGPDLWLFNEGDASGVYTHEVYVGGIAFTDRVLSDAEFTALGLPKAAGIFLQRLWITRMGEEVVLTWNGTPTTRLQRAEEITGPDWADVPGTLGAGSFSETIGGGTVYYRLKGF